MARRALRVVGLLVLCLVAFHGTGLAVASASHARHDSGFRNASASLAGVPALLSAAAALLAAGFGARVPANHNPTAPPLSPAPSVPTLDAATGHCVNGSHDPRADLTPRAFECWCADQLRRAGWQATVTGGPGDQGVDVRATLNGRQVVIQCKRLQTPARIDAVQAVFAGKAYFDAHDAVVVATSGFTPSARRLASKTGVRLLAPDQLEGLTVIPAAGLSASGSSVAGGKRYSVRPRGEPVARVLPASTVKSDAGRDGLAQRLGLDHNA